MVSFQIRYDMQANSSTNRQGLEISWKGLSIRPITALNTPIFSGIDRISFILIIELVEYHWVNILLIWAPTLGCNALDKLTVETTLYTYNFTIYCIFKPQSIRLSIFIHLGRNLYFLAINYIWYRLSMRLVYIVFRWIYV